MVKNSCYVFQCVYKIKDEVDFLHADKHQSFPQVGFTTLGIKFPAR